MFTIDESSHGMRAQWAPSDMRCQQRCLLHADDAQISRFHVRECVKERRYERHEIFDRIRVRAQQHNPQTAARVGSVGTADAYRR